jgi:hypothetical protein
VSQATLGRPAAASPLGDLLRLLSLPLLGFVAFAVGLATGIPSNRITLLGTAIATGMLVLSPLVVNSVRPPSRRHLLLALFALSYFAHFVLPVFVSYLGTSGYGKDTFAELQRVTPADIARGELAALVSFAMMLAGYALPLGAATARAVPKMEREWSHEAALGVALVMIILGWTVFLAGQLGLIPKRAGSGFLGTLADAAFFGFALLTIVYLRYRSRPALLMLLLLIPPTMGFNFFTASKQLFLMPLAMVATAHIMVTRRLRLWWLVGFVVAMMLLYPVAQTYRDYLFGNDLTAIQVITSPDRALGLLERFLRTSEMGEYMRTGLQATSNRLDALCITSVILRDAGERVPFQGGWSISYIVLTYVPRIVWPGKPDVTIGRWVTDYFGSGPLIQSATGPSWVGELYFNFGWAGIVVGMGILGVWFRFLHEAFLRPSASVPALLAGVVSLFALGPTLQGQLISPTNGVIFNVVPIMFAHLVVRSFTRPVPALPPAA